MVSCVGTRPLFWLATYGDNSARLYSKGSRWTDISNEQYIRETIERWDGRYCANEWQLVEEEDALNLAFALMIAVKVLPDEDDDSTIVHSIDHWSGADNKKILKDFIKYCMGGEFDIL